ncbi:valine--tRNA ligase, partial [Patescibacteria group bacterium]|nr:valine--tRNA ligase [Patescibacteria group bacterium]
FSLDWSRERYTLDPTTLETVFETFRQLDQDGLIYRDERIVNYCPHCGTAFSDLEVNHLEQDDLLYYLNYGPITIATTRPETIFADVAVAVHPKDKRYQNLIGKKATLPLVGRHLPIIADKVVKPEFGTGALKITPAHDQADFEVGQRHHLDKIKILNEYGKLINVPKKYLGLNVNRARLAVVEDLQANGLIVKTESLHHTIGICYRCKKTIEPTLMPQWYVKIKPLAQKAVEAVNKKQLVIYPSRFKKMYLRWLTQIHDWNISRQIVWGPRIPAWYCLDCHPEIVIRFLNKEKKIITGSWATLHKEYSFKQVSQGLQSLTAPTTTDYQLKSQSCSKCHQKHLLQETDTFDTWFSSGQWPLTALGFPNSKDFNYFFPTSVLDTGWDIIFFWVARMVMLSLYRTGQIPFKVVHLHCRVVDKHGKKMSKSKGNVVNPLGVVKEYGADALRLALVFGTAPGNDIAYSDNKVRAMRNFTNKLWNVNRFLHLNWPKSMKSIPLPEKTKLKKIDLSLIKKTSQLIDDVTQWLETYRYDLAIDALYQFIWHEVADLYIEAIKDRLDAKDKAALATFYYVNATCLKLLHPFAPFITEELWQNLPQKENQLLATSPWPKSKK